MRIVDKLQSHSRRAAELHGRSLLDVNIGSAVRPAVVWVVRDLLTSPWHSELAFLASVNQYYTPGFSNAHAWPRPLPLAPNVSIYRMVDFCFKLIKAMVLFFKS